MFRLATGLAGGVVGNLAVAIAYLFWPLPSAEMDWRELIEIHVASGDCIGYDNIFRFVPDSQLYDVVEYLEGTSIDARCPNPYRQREDGLTRQEEFDERVRQYEYHQQNSRVHLPPGLYPVWLYMEGSYYQRSSGGRPLLAYWPDFAIAARCEYWFMGEWDAWRWFRSMATDIEPPRHLEVARLARARECVAHINRQIASRPDDARFVESMKLVRMIYDTQILSSAERLEGHAE